VRHKSKTNSDTITGCEASHRDVQRMICKQHLTAVADGAERESAWRMQATIAEASSFASKIGS
jgi:L-amino acid N-acyltransferase YncA